MLTCTHERLSLLLSAQVSILHEVRLDIRSIAFDPASLRLNAIETLLQRHLKALLVLVVEESVHAIKLFAGGEATSTQRDQGTEHGQTWWALLLNSSPIVREPGEKGVDTNGLGAQAGER